MNDAEKTRIRKTGEQFAEGVTDHLLKLLVGYVIGALIIFFAIDAIGLFMDDSDTSRARSGLKPRLDGLTKCEYLETSDGGITPRLDANGQHICGRIKTGRDF